MNIGDEVRLRKSDGVSVPLAVQDFVRDDDGIIEEAVCAWRREDGSVARGAFPITALKKTKRKESWRD